MEEIYVDWSGPYTYEDVVNYNENKIETKKFAVKPTDFGLYQIYGAHPIYGDNVLIYIGKTEQKFMERLNGRSVIEYNQDRDNVQIYLGKIYYDDALLHNDALEDISKAESLLIHYHAPAKNSSNINSLKFADENYRVINLGTFRSLSKEISTTAFTKEHKIYSLIESIAEELKVEKSEIYNEEDCYGFFISDDIWFGLEYELWNSNTTLILASTKKINQKFEPYKIIDNEEWFYLSLYGEQNIIIQEIKKYQNKATSNAK